MIDLFFVFELFCNIFFKKNIEICNEVCYYVNIFVNYVSLILILFLFLGEVILGKYINMYIKGMKKFYWEIRNDLIVC